MTNSEKAPVTSNELLPFWNKAAREKLRAVGRDRMSTEAWQICESLLNRIDQLEAAALETPAPSSKGNNEPAAAGHAGWCLYRLDCERRSTAPRSCNCGKGVSLAEYVRRSMQWDWTELDANTLGQIQHSLRSVLSDSHETFCDDSFPEKK
jgi:hypothetical protein